jgi:hypothetical protein
MKDFEKLLHLAADCVFFACVTIAAMHFNSPNLLWWYVLVPILWVYRRNRCGGADHGKA